MRKSVKVTITIFVSMLIAMLALVSLIKKRQNCKGLCVGCSGCRNKQTQSSSYYIDKKERLLNDLQKKQKIFEPSLRIYYSNEQLKAIIQETRETFIRLIPDIPYIGGNENDMTEDIEQAAMVLAFYRVQIRYGRTCDEIGGIITESVKREIDKYPKWLKHVIGGKFFTKGHIEKLKQSCLSSQQKEYAGNWVTFYVEGDGSKFDYGYNHVECGIVKYLTRNDASELIPYLCSLDYLYSDAFDEGLTREHTIAESGEYCDFRYKRVK